MPSTTQYGRALARLLLVTSFALLTSSCDEEGEFCYGFRVVDSGGTEVAVDCFENAEADGLICECLDGVKAGSKFEFDDLVCADANDRRTELEDLAAMFCVD